MRIPCEEKLRNFAQQNTQMVADFTWPNIAGVPTFQWFDRQVVQGDLGKISDGRMCVTVRRLKADRVGNQGGVTPLSKVRLAIDVVGYKTTALKNAAEDVVGFMNTISLCNAGDFASPQTAPTQNPNFFLTQASGMRPELQPPAYVETLYYDVFNREDIPS